MCYILNETDMIRRHFKNELLKSTEDCRIVQEVSACVPYRWFQSNHNVCFLGAMGASWCSPHG